VDPTLFHGIVVAFFAFVIGGGAAMAYWVRQTDETVSLGSKRFRDLDALSARIERSLGLPATRLPARGRPGVLGDVRFGGKFEGREATLFFAPFEGAGEVARLSIAADAAARVRLTREGADARAKKLLRLVRDVDTGDPAFDGKFVVESEDPDWALRALELAGVKRQVERLYWRFPVLQLVLDEGQLLADFSPDALELENLRPAASALVELASAFDRMKLGVRVLGGERKAVRGHDGRARCGYCHTDITGEEPDLVACKICATTLHAACWVELGRCPVLGCKGKTYERSAVG
jgi:hypothetical protein